MLKVLIKSDKLSVFFHVKLNKFELNWDKPVIKLIKSRSRLHKLHFWGKPGNPSLPWGRSPGNLFLDKFWLNLDKFWLDLDKLLLKWIKSLLYSDKF